MKKLEEMINKDIERELKQFDETLEKSSEIKERISKGNICARYWNDPEWVTFANSPLFIYVKLNINYGYRSARERVIKGVKDHYIKLQAKVEKKIGKILEISETTNGTDYIIKGENGTCVIEVILAGGYNIQRLHTRWIIK